MTTSANIITAANNAVNEIWREPSGYVNIQQSAPYQDGRYGRGWVEHCGIAVGYVYAKAGLQMGRDFVDLAYTPTAARATFDKGFAVRTPQVGDWGIVDWQGAGWGQTGASDHAVLVIGTWNWPRSVRTREWNTTPDGRARDYDRPASLFVCFGRPKLSTGPVKGPWLDGGPVGIPDVQPGQTNTQVARVQDALINNRGGLNSPQMVRNAADGAFAANYTDWQRRLGFPGDGRPARTSLERLGFVVVDHATVQPALPDDWAAAAKPVRQHLGDPTGTPKPFLNANGPMHVPFQRGIIFDHAGQKLAVYGGIYGRWAADAGGRVGLPVSEEGNVPGVKGARWQHFQEGTLIWEPGPAGGTRVVSGGILESYRRLTDDERANLGYVRSDEKDTQPAGRWQQFQHGGIVWHPSTGAHPFWGGIGQTYLRFGGTRYVGFPKGKEQTTAGETVQRFTGADIVWAPSKPTLIRPL